MLTHATARYFAKQAHQLNLMTGRFPASFRQGAIRVTRDGDKIVVMDRDSDAWFAFTPAKAWTRL